MRILLADDSAVIRVAVSSLLAREGHEVIVAEDGVEAIQRFYENPPGLVLLDIQMPKVSGYLVCRLIKEDWSVANTPVLMLTARDTAEDRYWADKSGADGYLTKENLGEGLLGAIRSADASRALTALSGHQVAGHSIDQVEVLSRVVTLLDRKLFETTIVNDIVTMTTQPGDVGAAIGEALTILRRFVEYDLAGLVIAADRLLVVRPDRLVGDRALERFKALTAGQLHLQGASAVATDDLVVQKVETDGARVVEDFETEDWQSYFGLGLRLRGELIGVMALAAARPGAFTPQVARTLRLIENPVAAVVYAALHHQKALQEEARMSLTALSEKVN